MGEPARVDDGLGGVILKVEVSDGDRMGSIAGSGGFLG